MSQDERQDTRLDSRTALELRRLSESGIQPERDLWPGLQRKLRAPVRSAVRRHAVAAAAIVVVLAGIAWRVALEPSATTPRQVGSDRSVAEVPQAGSEEFRATFARYVDRRRNVLDVIAAQLEEYPPELRDDIHRSIEEIERAMRNIEESIAARSSNASSESRLAELYDLELRLLEVVRNRLGAAADGGVS